MRPLIEPRPSRWRRPLRSNLIASDGAIDGVDHGLDLDKLGSRAFRIVAIERRRKHLCMGITVFDHARAGSLERIQAFTHLGQASYRMLTYRP
jgi:hypothetical protein